MNISYCFGIKSLGECSSYFLFEHSVYNLGIAIGTIAIILAAYQFLNERIHFRIRFRKKWRNFALFLFLLNLLGTFVAAITPYVPGIAMPIIGYPITWELLSAIFFIWSIFIMIRISISPITKIEKKDMKRFTSLCHESISHSEFKLEALAEEVRYFIPSVIRVAEEQQEKEDTENFKRSQEKQSDKVKDKKENHQIQYATPASTLLFILSDPELCKIIANKCPLTVQSIIQSYQKYGWKRDRNIEHYKLLAEVFSQSLTNEQSIIARELKRKGIGSVNKGRGVVAKLIIEDWELINRASLLGSFFTRYEFSQNKVYRTNFVFFWERVIDSFFEPDKVDENLIYSSCLKDGLETIESFLQENLKEEKKFRLFSWTHQLHCRIKEYQKKKKIYYKKRPIPAPKIDKNGFYAWDSWQEKHDIYGNIAYGLYKILEEYVNHFLEDPDYRFESICSDIYKVIDFVPQPISSEENPVFFAINERFELLLWQKIQENAKRYYPMVLRAFFHIYGWSIFTEPQRVENNDFVINVLSLLADRLPKIKKGYVQHYSEKAPQKILKQMKEGKAKEVLSNMFPEGFLYESKGNKLCFYYSDNIHYSEISLSEVKQTKKIKIKKG